MASVLPFSLNWYLSQNPDIADAVSKGLIEAFEHFEMYGKAEGRSANPLFNTAEYLDKNADVAAAVARGEITAYDHFVTYGAGEGRSPLSLFDEAFYLLQNPDVAQAVEAGAMTAVQHFLMYGQSEPRPFNAFIDLGEYLKANPDVAQAVEDGFVTAMGHLMTYGAHEPRDLGNGVHLGDFANDPAFNGALASGNFEAALGRVGDVAPFLSTFEKPAGWIIPPNTPIPIGFVPAEGKHLVIPEGFKVPEGTKLPEIFKPVAPVVPPVTPPVLGDTVAPVLGDGATFDGSTRTVTIDFSENLVNAGDQSALKASITYSVDGAEYVGLRETDRVAIKGDKLVITFADDFASVANKLTVTVAAGALKDAANNAVADIITGGINLFTVGYKDLSTIAAPDSNLYAGTTNPATGFVVASNAAASIELGLDVRYKGDPTDVRPNQESANTFTVDAARLADVRFAYSVASTDGTSKPLDLASYNVQLKIDIDGSDATNFLIFDLIRQDSPNAKQDAQPSPYEWVLRSDNKTVITDDGGNQAVTQNIQALHWYMAGKPESIAQGGKYTLALEAHDIGTKQLLALSEIIILGGVQYKDLSTIAAPSGNLYAGTTNSAKGFVVASNAAAGIELGLDVRYRGDATDLPLDSGSTNTFTVDAARLADARFAYSVASTDGTSKPLDLASYNVQLKIDTDGSDATNFLIFDLIRQDSPSAEQDAQPSPYEWVLRSDNKTVITDDGGNEAVTQNIQALHWYLAGKPDSIAQGGKYTVALEAHDIGTGQLLAQSEIIVLGGVAAPVSMPLAFA